MAARVVILPELVAFVSCVQWIVAPWLSYLNPPEYFLYGIRGEWTHPSNV